MIRSSETYGSGEALACDVLVVGAGPAGIASALTLARAGADVILVEAGGFQPDARVQDAYAGGVLQPADHRLKPLDETRLRYLGGTSNHWGGWCRPLLAETFGLRPGVADVSWPFDATELAPFMEEAHAWLELESSDYDPRRTAVGIDAALPELGPELEPVVWRFSPPTRFGIRYRADLEEIGLRVLLDAPVVELVVESGSARRALIRGRSGPLTVSFGDVVLATGGLETSRALLVMERRNPGLDLNRSGWLGRGWLEHPHMLLGHALVDEGALDGLGPFLGTTSGPSGPVRFGLAPTTETSDAWRSVAMSATLELIDEAVYELPDGTTALRSVAPLVHQGSGTALIGLYLRAEQRPSQENRVDLLDEVDSEGVPRIRLSWSVGQRDRDDYRRFARSIASAFGSGGLGLVHDLHAPSPAERVRGGAHHMGGARASEDPTRGVTDPHGRLHACPNAWVASAATFPTACFANPTLTIVALALRVAEALGRR